MTTSQDKRRQKRFAKEVPVEVKVVSCPGNPALRRQRYRCMTRDASICGLQIQSEVLLPPGTVLTIWVEVETDKETYTLELTGDVKWSNQFPQAGCVAGIYLRDRPRGDMQLWMDTMSEELKRRFAQT
jgi:hypothetical protein